MTLNADIVCLNEIEPAGLPGNVHLDSVHLNESVLDVLELGWDH
jgi:hypothetical protein